MADAGIAVTLSPQEMYAGGLVGYRRNLESIVRKRKPRFPEKHTGELFAFHILAAMAELAVAKSLGVYWSFHENKFSGGDVGQYEVRFSARKDLKVRERDKGVVVSVSGYPPNFVVVGWIDADDAKRPEWSKDFGFDGPPAYFVPRHELKAMDSLL